MVAICSDYIKIYWNFALRIGVPCVLIIVIFGSRGLSQTALQQPVTRGSCDRKAGEVCVHCGVHALRMRWCPSWEYVMGSPESESDRSEIEKQVKVRLRGFWVGETEVTQEQWEYVMSTRPWVQSAREIELGGIPVGPRFPAHTVSFNDAVLFCKKLTDQERSSGRLSRECEFSLPTAAQWEYACRASTTTTFSFGNDRSKLSEYASEREILQRVGMLKPNSWGIFDMEGNLAEWCLDSYSFSEPIQGGVDPVFIDEGNKLHVQKGGDWLVGGNRCRCANRAYGGEDDRNFLTGFRVVLQQAR
ncbi:formylglycine-generating enzyme family protein [Flavobacterium sp.]|uniref:formylglycine-generating enzyme family protein n=1 Tax=Flavobacterium sp. TaxID=239 RepID=UPI0037BFAE58